jgi:hypothetical protein
MRFRFKGVLACWLNAMYLAELHWQCCQHVQKWQEPVPVTVVMADLDEMTAVIVKQDRWWLKRGLRPRTSLPIVKVLRHSLRLVSFFFGRICVGMRDYHIWKPSRFPVFFGAQTKSHRGRDLPATSHNGLCDLNCQTSLRVSRSPNGLCSQHCHIGPSVAVAHFLRWSGCQLTHFKNFQKPIKTGCNQLATGFYSI